MVLLFLQLKLENEQKHIIFFIKFRLRDLSGSTQTHVNTVPKYKTPRYKYDRKVMIGYFNNSEKGVPEQLKSIEQICIEEMQDPIAFDGINEEEVVRNYSTSPVDMKRLIDCYFLRSSG